MLTIRELRPEDDFDRVGRVYAESWKAFYRDILPQPYLDKLTHDRWSATLRAAPSASLGAFFEEELIGTSLVRFAHEPEREGYGEIVSLYLLPSFVGRGFGARLLAAALRKLQNEGCMDACLWTLSDNRRAIGFYERMGFRRSGRIQKEIFGGKELELSEFCRRTLPDE